MAKPTRTTSADIARAAGVSRATVSYVLNGRTDQGISETTRQKVLETVEELGYVPHAASRALRAGESRMVLLIRSAVPWSTNLTDTEDELTRLVAESGRSLVVWRRHGPGDLHSTLTNLGPCVVISMTELSRTEIDLLDNVGVPLVAMDVAAPGGDIVGRVQADHLMRHGHERLGYLTTSDEDLQPFAGPRLTGFLEACAVHGLPEPRVAALPGGLHLTIPAVKAQLEAWQAEPDPVTAVACFNDYHAAALLVAAVELGIWVPSDLAVIGVDDDIFAPLTFPALTTLRLDVTSYSRHVWATTRHALGEGPEPAPYTLAATVVERASVENPGVIAR